MRCSYDYCWNWVSLNLKKSFSYLIYKLKNILFLISWEGTYILEYQISSSIFPSKTFFISIIFFAFEFCKILIILRYLDENDSMNLLISIPASRFKWFSKCGKIIHSLILCHINISLNSSFKLHFLHQYIFHTTYVIEKNTYKTVNFN
jgi:hypothetical protein